MIKLIVRNDQEVTVTSATLKRIALLLISVALLSNAAYADSSSRGYSWYVSGNKLDIYVRVFVPGNKSSSWIGHYDLQIKGKITFGGKVFTNPCFSYGTGGKLLIFSASDTATVYKSKNYSKCSTYTWHFTIRNTKKLGAFLAYLSKSLKTVKTYSRCSRAFICKFKTNEKFSYYNVYTVNCFTAVATWLKGFGNSSLYRIYRNAYRGGVSYKPIPFVHAYASHLTRVK